MFTQSIRYLPAVLFFSLLLFVSVGLWFDQRTTVGLERPSDGAFRDVLSPTTIDALRGDARLHHALLSLTEYVATTSEKLGKQYGSEGLESFGRNLTEELTRIYARPSPKKRGFLEDLGNLITGGGNGNNQQPQGDTRGNLLEEIGNALGIGGDGNNTGLGGLLQGGLSSLGDSIIGGLATPALFLGIGVGMGAGTGLNLTNMEQAKTIATQVAATFEAEPTGVNMVAQNLGSGVSAQIAPSLRNLSIGDGVGMAVFALAQGIGQGSARGLNLTQQQFQPINDSSIIAIASNFGLGVSQPIASSIDLPKLISQGADGGQLVAQLPHIAAAAGQGLGQGASTGLGLSKPNTTLQRRQALGNSDQIDVPATVMDFTRGLSQAFLQSSDLNKAVDMIAPNATDGLNIDLAGMLVPIAAGAGKGIGQGAAVGLGFQADTGIGAVAEGLNAEQSTEMIAQQFSKGLVSSFLANGTATVALNNLTSGAGSLAQDVQFARVAEGLARGLVEGSVNAISSVGGVNSLISGNFSAQAAMNLPSMGNTSFEDSVNGSAVAFGRGLAGEGTLLIASLISNMTKSTPQKRIHQSALSRRQDVISNGTPLAISGDMLSSLAQAGTDALTCQGFGGVIAIGLGLMHSGTIKLDTKDSPLDGRTLAALPQDPIIVTSEGNRFSIKIQNGEIKINDLEAGTFIALTAVHVISMTVTFFYALPAYIALGAIQRLSILIGNPINESKCIKWRKIILFAIFTPFLLLGVISGVLGIGKAQHFRSPHGILGLITTIIALPAIITSIQRLRSSQPQPTQARLTQLLIQSPRNHTISATLTNLLVPLSTTTSILGLSLLRSISLCTTDALLPAPLLAVVLLLITCTQIGATSLVALRLWIEHRIARNKATHTPSLADKKGSSRRTDTIATFGFDTAPPAGAMAARNTKELFGREDSRIGWPSEVRKVGEEDGGRDGDRDGLAEGEMVRGSRRYDEKIGGFVDVVGHVNGGVGGMAY
ncbi:hypothetical protein EJ04DRAFT_578009 [Polyplosphaeria fusca]|uniref:Uncharacterized protein n=1 Tax=Polyplosphaeria fusca TaxID=682080 RepID=A0A9P4QXY0_9PLEO|nr:hypothetical protein EJ04DRAFT_578009 [Polyplosphaeria fusca]